MQEFFNNIMPNVVERFPTFLQAIWDTIIMVIWSGSIAFGLGMLFGVMLTVTKPVCFSFIRFDFYIFNMLNFVFPSDKIL